MPCRAPACSHQDLSQLKPGILPVTPMVANWDCHLQGLGSTIATRISSRLLHSRCQEGDVVVLHIFKSARTAPKKPAMFRGLPSSRSKAQWWKSRPALIMHFLMRFSCSSQGSNKLRPPMVHRGIDQKKPSLLPSCLPFWQKNTITVSFQNARLDLCKCPNLTTPKTIIQAESTALH